MTDYIAEARSQFDYLRKMRRDFHQHPELGMEEVRTAKVIAAELSALGLKVQTGVAKTGVVAMVEGARPGKTILLRFDIDALPIQETTGAVYASVNPGVMHACGHDGHAAVGLTVARMLYQHRSEFAGQFKLIFQPAEEKLNGAKVMVQEGVLENPKVDLSLAMHLWNDKPVGWLGITPGPFMAAADSFSLTVTGKGGHSAVPHRSIDPVYATAQIITAAQSVISRNIPPMDTCVVSFCTIHAGDAFNIIPSEVKVLGSLRSFKTEVRALAIERLQQICSQVGSALGCKAVFEIMESCPATVNDPEVTRRVQAVAQRTLPQLEVDPHAAEMGSEDMSFIQELVPGCYVFVGSANAEKGLDAPHHNPKFDFDEEALVYGAGLIAAAGVDLLS